VFKLNNIILVDSPPLGHHVKLSNGWNATSRYQSII